MSRPQVFEGFETTSARWRFSLDGEVGEHAPLLGDVRDAQRRDVLGRQVRDVPSLVGDRPVLNCRRARARDAPERRGLARAVTAQQRAYLPFLDVHRHVAEDVTLAVVAVDGVEFGSGSQFDTSEVRLLDVRVALYFIGRPSGDDLALV